MNKKQLVKLISFMATFDGGLYVVNRKDRPMKTNNAMFILNMREENKDYIEWVKQVLENITGVIIEKRKDYNKDIYNRKPQLRLYSKRHPFLTSIRDRLYTPDNKKIIDLHMLKLLDAEALAIIFMTDGGTHLNKNKYPEISLHTKGFSEADNLALSKAIYEKLGIRTTVNRQNKYFFLRVKTKDIPLFLNTIRDHVLPSFWYKFERLAPAMGDDIVWPWQKCQEIDRNIQS